MTRDRDHPRVVGAIFKWRDKGVPSFSGGHVEEGCPEPAIGGYTARNAEVPDAGLPCGFSEFVEQDRNDAALDGSANVRQVLVHEARVARAIVPEKIQNRCLEAAEAEIQAGDLGLG